MTVNELHISLRRMPNELRKNMLELAPTDKARWTLVETLADELQLAELRSTEALRPRSFQKP